MATSRFSIIKNNGDKIINYRSNFSKANQAFEKLKSKYKKVKVQYYRCGMNYQFSYFETSRGNTWKFMEQYDPFGCL